MKRRAMLILLGVLLAVASAAGTEPPAASQSAAPDVPGAGPAEARPAARYFTDVILLNQDGEEMRFYTDLLKDKVVVINTIFTTCTGICPVMSRSYLQLQEHLGDRLGEEVHLISISVDPENDTPPRLKEFGDRYDRREGWHLLTGKKENVELALSKLGQWVDQKDDHTAIVLMGNDRTGLWKKTMGLAPAKELIRLLDSVLLDKGVDPAGAGGVDD